MLTPGYTDGMNSAGSLPDDLIHASECHARRPGGSPSRLHAYAIAEHLARHPPDEVTQAMDRVVDRLSETVAADFVARAVQSTLKRSEW